MEPSRSELSGLGFEFIELFYGGFILLHGAGFRVSGQFHAKHGAVLECSVSQTWVLGLPSLRRKLEGSDPVANTGSVRDAKALNSLNCSTSTSCTCPEHLTQGFKSRLSSFSQIIP